MLISMLHNRILINNNLLSIKRLNISTSKLKERENIKIMNLSLLMAKGDAQQVSNRQLEIRIFKSRFLEEWVHAVIITIMDLSIIILVISLRMRKIQTNLLVLRIKITFFQRIPRHTTVLRKIIITTYKTPTKFKHLTPQVQQATARWFKQIILFTRKVALKAQTNVLHHPLAMVLIRISLLCTRLCKVDLPRETCSAGKSKTLQERLLMLQVSLSKEEALKTKWMDQRAIKEATLALTKKHLIHNQFTTHPMLCPRGQEAIVLTHVKLLAIK